MPGVKESTFKIQQVKKKKKQWKQKKHLTTTIRIQHFSVI